MANDPVGIRVVIITGKGREYINSRGQHAIEYDTATLIKTGDPVFIAGGKYRHGSIEYWVNTGKFRLSDVGKLGKTVFLTRDAAEAKVEEWKAKKYDPTYDPQWEVTDEEI